MLLRKDGFIDAAELLKVKRLMIGTDGLSNSGKSEFANSAPGPGVNICVDRGIDSMLRNQNPPSTRSPNFVYKVVKVPLATQATQDTYKEYWKAFYADYKAALSDSDIRTVVVDGDSDTWELQRLAEFGKLTQIPSILYTGVNAARRAMYARAWDSGKIIIATNKVSKEYKALLDPEGRPIEKDGKVVREWDGSSMKRQGFDDQDYLWQIQLRHLFNADRTTWGIRIMKCKADPTLIGLELWGEDCNMPSLLQTVYPNVSLEEWGYR